MASHSALARLARLWQIPLLLVSLALFGYAAFLFINPAPRATIAQRTDLAEASFKAANFDPALEQCNKLLAIDKINPADEARLHLLIAAILDGAQKEHHLSLAPNHQRIVEQIQAALELKAQPTFDIYRRLAESQEALGNIPEALKAYRLAIATDAKAGFALQRKVIELGLTQADPAAAEASIAEFLKVPKISDIDRAWALDEQAQTKIKRGKFIDGQAILKQALALDRRMTSQGVGHYWLGYCTWKLGDAKEAERLLRVARDQLTIGHPLDADAAYLLGKMRQAANDPKEADSFYHVVLTSHPASRPEPLARLNRGICRIKMGDDPAGLVDLHDAVKEVQAKKNRQSYLAEAVEGLQQATAALKDREDLQGAIEALEDEQTLVPDPPPEFFARLAHVVEKRADQVEATLASSEIPAERAKTTQQVRKLRTEAGDAYIALSRGITLSDDRGQGEALWKGVDLYDQAGASQQSISAMEQFIAERPGDGKTPDALLRLGRTYQATGQFDKAIKKFLQNQFRYPQSLAASRSGVPLAQAYMAKGPEFYPKAEKTLLAVLENNQILTPESEEFRQALFELAQLQYRTGRYEDAIARLEESTQRYPHDKHMGQLLFLMADSYRKSAGLLTASMKVPAPTSATQPTSPAEMLQAASARAEASSARHDRLLKAKGLFDRVIDLARTVPPSDDLDRLYLKLSHFYRADCLYDVGEYEEAIRLYDSATLRYQDDPSSVAAYVQIVNAYCALGRLDDARTANERAKWLLRKMPADAFAAGKSAIPKTYWDDWLRWTAESGIYARGSGKTALTDAR